MRTELELRHLQSFVTTAEQQNFTRAAALLGIAQPSLSLQIKKLEHDLGVKLFHRTKRFVRLTSAGRVILRETRSLLAQARITRETAEMAASGDMGDLAVGFIESATFVVLPKIIRTFQAKYPRVTLTLHELSTEEQLSALHERTIDVGILRTPIQEDEVQTTLLERDALVVVLPQAHRLYDQSRISLRSLRHERFILYATSKARRLRNEIEGLCSRAGFLPAVQEVSELHSACGLVAAGLGISLVPSSANVITIPGIGYRKLANPNIAVEYSAAWLTGSQVPTVTAFSKSLTQRIS